MQRYKTVNFVIIDTKQYIIKVKYCICCQSSEDFYYFCSMKKEALVRRLCILLFLSVCLFVFWGTKRGLWIDRTKGSLINIDTLLTRNLLDSARNELDEISLNRIQSKADSAYYFLLNTETNYRLHGPNPSDSSICYSVNYYESTNNKELLARAYYYKGYSKN